MGSLGTLLEIVPQRQNAIMAGATTLPLITVVADLVMGARVTVEPVQVQAQMLAANVVDALADPAVMAGILVGSFSGIVLLDSSCTHYFTSYEHVSKMGADVLDVGCPLIVNAPLGVVITTGLYVKIIQVVIQLALVVHFYWFWMIEFYVIFGMDWISKNKVMIDCHKKKVHFKKGRNCFAFQGGGRDLSYGFMVLSWMVDMADSTHASHTYLFGPCVCFGGVRVILWVVLGII